MPFCKTCGEYTWNIVSHKCPPIFEVRRENEDDDYWTKIRASDGKKAAEKWADRDDCETAEYSIVGGEEAVVLVRKSGSKDSVRFLVRGEAVPEYWAEPHPHPIPGRRIKRWQRK